MTMSIRTPIRGQWRPIVAVAYFAFLLWIFGGGLYGALFFGTLPGNITFENNPVVFVLMVLVAAPLTLISGGLLVATLFGWRSEVRIFQKREARPPLDNAIREPLERGR
jgi:hypothetical protein